MNVPAPTEALSKPPLHELHLAASARLMAFAGWEMPARFEAGTIEEHLHTRRSVSLFDISHMGLIEVSGLIDEVARGLEALIPIDIADLSSGRQRYGFLLDQNGGILDDVIVAKLGNRFIVVANAANTAAVVDRLRALLPAGVNVRISSDAFVALQGPCAEAALATLAAPVHDMIFMDVQDIDVLGVPCVVSRSGYTGEDGFEISIPREHALAVAQALLAQPNVMPAGLGARDTLRLEAGLPLHGADISAATTPAEAGVAWAIPSVRRLGGARAGGFPGAERVLGELETGPRRCRVGLMPEGRAPVRSGAALFESETSEDPIGHVTSGGYGPSVRAPIAMGLVPAHMRAPGRRLFADVRGQRLALSIRRLPFVPARFKRHPAAADQETSC